MPLNHSRIHAIKKLPYVFNIQGAVMNLLGPSLKTGRYLHAAFDAKRLVTFN